VSPVVAWVQACTGWRLQGMFWQAVVR